LITAEPIMALFCATLAIAGVETRDAPQTALQAGAIHERWHERILTTVFWVGEPANELTGSACNRASAWDMRWMDNFGGTDHPTNRDGFRPAGFQPKQNPFYVALPFNDRVRRLRERPIAIRFLNFWKPMIRALPVCRSLCKNRWIEIRFRGKSCFAQWQDVGPVYTDDDLYVFGFEEPRSHARGMAGLDVSPAVRDFLKFPGSGKTDWKFSEADEVPDGPWLEIVTQD
jgi:hypothetical protein